MVAKSEARSKSKTETKAKTEIRSSSMSHSARKKTNLSRLCIQMGKMSADAVDKEIIKRFKIIIDTAEDDITKGSLEAILSDPSSVEVTSFHESLQPYIKHYLFMLKRNASRASAGQ